MATETKAATSGRIVVVSGSTGSIGKEIALGAARQPDVTLILPVRDTTRGAAMAEEIKRKSGNSRVVTAELELSSQQSIEAFAEWLRTNYGRVDVVVNCAAIVPDSHEVVTRPARAASEAKGAAALPEQKFERQWAVNVLSYYLMTTRLRPLVAQAVPAGSGRIVNVASNYAGGLDLTDTQFTRRKYSPNSAYRASTQARRMLSTEAGERFKGDKVTVNSCHPGVVASTLLSGLGGGRGSQTAAEGAATPLYCAFAPEAAGVTASYFDRSRKASCNFSEDADGRAKLWSMLEAAAGDAPAASTTR